MEKRIVAFCNLSNRFIEQIRTHLQSQNIEIVTVNKAQGTYEEYVKKLAERLLVSIRNQSFRSDISLYVLVVSGSNSENDALVERGVFFPATRYKLFNRSVELSQPAARKFVEELVGDFKKWKDSNLNKTVRPGKNNIALLPIRNVGSPKFKRSLEKIWSFESSEMDPVVSKDIATQKGDRGIMASGLEFRACLNSPGHPVRRCTDSFPCDLKAELRLGHRVPPNFEFDVSSSGNLSGRKFFRCDGREEKVDKAASHLNMRINDDFKPGYK